MLEQYLEHGIIYPDALVPCYHCHSTCSFFPLSNLPLPGVVIFASLIHMGSLTITVLRNLLVFTCENEKLKSASDIHVRIVGFWKERCKATNLFI